MFKHTIVVLLLLPLASGIGIQTTSFEFAYPPDFGGASERLTPTGELLYLRVGESFELWRASANGTQVQEGTIDLPTHAELVRFVPVPEGQLLIMRYQFESTEDPVGLCTYTLFSVPPIGGFCNLAYLYQYNSQSLVATNFDQLMDTGTRIYNLPDADCGPTCARVALDSPLEQSGTWPYAGVYELDYDANTFTRVAENPFRFQVGQTSQTVYGESSILRKLANDTWRLDLWDPDNLVYQPRIHDFQYGCGAYGFDTAQYLVFQCADGGSAPPGPNNLIYLDKSTGEFRHRTERVTNVGTCELARSPGAIVSQLGDCDGAWYHTRINFSNQAPVIDSVATPRTVYDDHLVQVSALAHDLDGWLGDELEYVWTIGQASAEGAAVQFPAQPAGDHTIHLRVEDTEGGFKEVTRDLTVLARPVQPTNQAPTLEVNCGVDLLSVSCEFNVDDDQGSPVLVWEIAGHTGSASSMSLELPEGAHEFAATATDGQGLAVTRSGVIQVGPYPGPVLSLTAPAQAQEGAFEATASYSQGTPPIAIQWWVNGIQTDTGDHLQVSLDPGSYELRVDVVDALGKTDTRTQSVTISAAPSSSASTSESPNPTSSPESQTGSSSASGSSSESTPASVIPLLFALGLLARRRR